MQEIPVDLSRGVSGKPLAHFLVGPVPRKRVCIEPVVLRPGGVDVAQELVPTMPRATLQIPLAEGADEQLRLVQPRGMDWRKAGTPPLPVARPIVCRSAGRMARIAVLDQK